MDTIQNSTIAMPTYSDALLRASRRVDWRFLLPDPDLKRVAYIGPAQGSLLESLRLFANGLDVYAAPALDVNHVAQAGEQHNQYNVVVAHTPSYAALKQAVALTSSDGFLYAEARGLIRSSWRQYHSLNLFPRQPRLWFLHHYTHIIKILGLAKIETFWFWPNFDECTKIIPLDDPITLMQFQMSYQRYSVVNSLLQSQTVQQLLYKRLLKYIIPCFGIVARHAEPA